jgi:hypothetical protein
MGRNDTRSAGKGGSRFRASREGKAVGAGSENEPVLVDQAKLPEHPASVGFSVSVGFNTDYGKEKLDVSAWLTLPSDTTEEAIKETFEEIVTRVFEQAHLRLDQGVQRYFPHLAEED